MRQHRLTLLIVVAVAVIPAAMARAQASGGADPSNVVELDRYSVGLPASADHPRTSCGILGPSHDDTQLALIAGKTVDVFIIDGNWNLDADHYPVTLRIGAVTLSATFEKVGPVRISAGLTPREQASEFISHLFDAKPIEVSIPDADIDRIAGPTQKVRNAFWACLHSIGQPYLGDTDPLSIQ